MTPGGASGPWVDVTARPIFVLGCTWRCGSTFLQRYINSTGGAFIWGENLGLVQRVIDAVMPSENLRRQIEEQRRAEEQQGDSAWIAVLSPEPELIPILRQLLLTFYANATARRGVLRWGFKEIRHGSEITATLLQAFPDGRAVHLIRNPRACVASISGTGWLDNWGGAKLSIGRWKENCRSFRDFADPRVVTLRLEDFELAPDHVTEDLGKHLGIAPNAFNKDLLTRVVRGTNSSPKLGPDEEALLEDAELHEIARHFGYKEF